MPPMIVARPMGIMTPDTGNFERSEAPTRMGMSNTTIGVLFMNALRIAPATRVATSASTGREAHDHHERANRDQRLVAETREKMYRANHDLAILDVGEQLEPGGQHDQDGERRRFQRYVVAREQVQRDNRENQYGNAMGVWSDRLQSVPCRLR